MSQTNLVARRLPFWTGRSSRQVRAEIEGFLYASPFILGVLAFWVIPLGYSIALVFMDWNLLAPPKFVGLGNVVKMIGDKYVGLSLYNTAFYTFISVPLHLMLALALALALNQPLRGVSAYRTIFYLPAVTPAVASSIIWLQILHSEFGLLNQTLAMLGIEGPRWLWEPDLAKPVFIVMTFWTIGPQMVIFLAGLQAVPGELHEAAAIDGASTWQRFRSVTLPMLSPVIFFNLVIGIIGSFQIFTAAFLMTAGGPDNATLFKVLYIYRNAFQYFSMGYAAALAWLLFWIILAFTFLQFKLGRQWVYYETELKEG
ncbi:MAG: sugar ABC transporter permease [Chloroflexi bacterium]|nr:sugar ABC transporter permease [Chloroflexota bacterium]